MYNSCISKKKKKEKEKQLNFLQKDDSRVSDQNGVSLLHIMLEIHHSGWEPWMYCDKKYFVLYWLRVQCSHTTRCFKSSIFCEGNQL